jgi:DNA-directed RNA polymerase specialized sigma24 family protein
MNKREAPSKEAFEKLLAWLDPDREKAVEKYQRIQFRVTRILSAKGCIDAEDLADQTFNVVALKTDWLIENYVGDPALYFYAVANKIFLEQSRKKKVPRPPPPPDNSEIERGCGCLEKCLDTVISPQERQWVLRYHQGDGQERIKNRKELAEELGITLNALRIKICHIQARLRPCVKKCLEQSAG